MKKKLLIASLLLLGITSFAQQGDIIYTDYGEGFSIHFDRFNLNDCLSIDLNCDSVPEFTFRPGHDTHNTLLILLDATDAVTGGWWTEEYCKWRLVFKHEYFLGDSLVIGDPIAVGDTLSLEEWGDAFEYVPPRYIYDLPDPDFPPPGSGYFAPHFIGVRHQINDDFYYGWMQVSVYIQDVAEPGQAVWEVGKYADVTVYQMAWCTIPNYPLRVAQTSLSWGTMENSEQFLVSVLPNPTNGQVTVIGKELKQVDVHNAIGQHVTSIQDVGNLLKMDLSGQPAGIYFLNITDQNGKRCVKKVVKE